MKNRLFEILEVANDGDTTSRIFDLFIITLILLDVIVLFSITFNLSQSFINAALAFDMVVTYIFTLEYLLRIWTSNLLYPDLPPWKARLKYIFTFMAIIDFIAIAPNLLPFVLPVELMALRLLRMLKIFRLFKLNRYSNSLSSIAHVFKRKAYQLLSSMFVVMLLMIIASLIMYSFEHDAQPTVFKNAFSGLWWAVATLTTVGYGDIYPVTDGGKIFSAIIAILGIGLVAVPTGIISSGFIEEIEDEKRESRLAEQDALVLTKEDIENLKQLAEYIKKIEN